jgi:hypothetical protein
VFSRGFRRSALVWWGAGLIVSGLLLRVGITLAGDWLPAELTTSLSWQEAFAAIYENVTLQLVLSANALVLVGAIVLLATWLLGEARAAQVARRRSAPVLREHALASWLGWAIVMYAMFAFVPALSSRTGAGILLLVVLSAIGFWALRRQVIQLTPAPATAPTTTEGAAMSSEDRLTRLADLHDRGVLDDDEFEAARSMVAGRQAERSPDDVPATDTRSTT